MCFSSRKARTQEAPPVGLIGLQVRVEGQRTVSALWTAVIEPNGAILYDVFFNGIFYVDPGKDVQWKNGDNSM